MDNIRNKLDSSRIVVIVSVIYVIIITAIGMYLYMKFNEKERYDAKILKRLEDHESDGITMYVSNEGFYNPNQDGTNRIVTKYVAPPGSENEGYNPVSLVNCHIKTAFNCCAVNTYRNSWVSIKALEYCLKIGMKCLDFEIYSVNSKPVIGLNSREKNIDMKESFNKIPLEDVITAIRMFSSSSSTTSPSVKELPLILHFRIKTKQKDTLKTFAQQITYLDNLYTKNCDTILEGDENECFIYDYLYDNENGGDVTSTLKNKIIVIANFSSIYNKGEIEFGSEFYNDYISNTKIGSSVNLISPSKFCAYITNRFAETTLADNQPKIEENKLNLSAPFADFEGSCVSFNPDNVRKSGVQLIGLCAQKNLERNENEMVYKYFKVFSDNKDNYFSYIAKKSDLNLFEISA